MIPVAKPFFGDEEARAAADVIASGWVAQGPKVLEFEKAFAAYVDARHACAVSNCTAALHAALLAVGVKSGNVVITVSHSFIATANSIRYCGAEPVFVDIDPGTFNMSVSSLTGCLQQDCETRGGQLFYKNTASLAVNESPLARAKPGPEFGRVAAIVVVHQMGLPCDLRSILPLAKKYHVPVIEDAACATGSELRMEDAGAWDKIGQPHGDIACFSFHPRKVMVTAEGGMLTTNDAKYDSAVRLLRHQGMSVSDLQRHNSKEMIVESYPQLGFNYRMTDIQAAIGIEQLKKMPAIIARRRALAKIYQDELRTVSWLTLPQEPSYAKSNWQSFAVRLTEQAPRDQKDFMQYLLDNGVSTRPGIMNAHEEKPYAPARFPLKNSELARKSAVILPLFPSIDEDDVHRVIQLIKNA